MSTRINSKQSLCAVAVLGILVGCTSTVPPPLPARNPANPQALVPMNAPHNVFVHDPTTLAIQDELSRSDKAAKGAESMQHVTHGEMPEIEHGEMKTEGQKNAPPAAQQANSQAFYYTCVMHPQVHESHPGKCPICGMTLVRKEGVPPK